jgi:hypothetical protein
MIWLGGLLPPASFFTHQDAYLQILGYTPQLLIASFAAYVVGEFLNSFVLAKMKIATKGRWLWARTIGSTLVGEGADSLVFLSILSLAGMLPVGQLPSAVLLQWLVKSAYEIIATPLTYGIVAFLKRTEHADFYDYNTNFNPFRIEA